MVQAVDPATVVRHPAYRPPSIREVSLRIRSSEEFCVEFYGWLDDFYRYAADRERMVRDGIAPVFDRRLEAFVAAAVHHLCLRYGISVPPWVNDERYCPKEPWFYPAEVSVRPIQFVESPAAFRARNIFTLFEHVRTDGAYWYSRHSGERLGALCDFRIGILFEPGRKKHELVASA